VTFTTNVIALVVGYIVLKRKSWKLRESMPYIMLILLSMSITIEVLNHYYEYTDLYDWTRIASIFFNVLVCIVLLLEMRKRYQYTLQLDPVRALTYRMIFYPVVQVISLSR
jgi:amino acid permease